MLSELYFYLWFPTYLMIGIWKITLWIAFRIVFLLMIPNTFQLPSGQWHVVNCFQNCIFTYDSQLCSFSACSIFCCELLSELYFYLWFPTELKKFIKEDSLWIAFRIVFLLMIPNIINQICKALEVVNCFQNCIFTYDSQHIFANRIDSNGCELLSELYFYLWFPTKAHLVTWLNQLWIAFRIVFLLMIPNASTNAPTGVASCELLSELYFYLWFPTLSPHYSNCLQLWIAFRIVFLLMIPNFLRFWVHQNTVVNCFQNCIFTYDSQLFLFLKDSGVSCELLSELYFYLWFPTTNCRTIRRLALWIAFRIVFLLMIPNTEGLKPNLMIVVNCFQNCIFTYDSQHGEKQKSIEYCCELLSELYFYLWFPTIRNGIRMDWRLWIAFRIVFLLMIPNI